MWSKTNGQLHREWGWLIAAYLFLGGVGSGAYAIAAFNGFVGKAMEPATRVGLWIGFPALAIGSLCLLADLGSPLKAVLAGMKPRTSWIARGVWIISAFMLLSLIHLLLFLRGDVERGGWLVTVVAVLGILTAVGTMAYTGLLLVASKGIPFWRSGVVPVVFVISAFVTGHCTLMLGMLLVSRESVTAHALRIMGLEAAVIVGLEALAIALYLQSSFRLAESRDSTRRILRNRAFVVGYLVLGLAAPFVLMLLLGLGMPTAGTGAVLAIAALGALLGLLGGLILRWSVLDAGTMPTWNLAGLEFRRTARPHDAKPDVGLLPPA